jgi:shikimate kinase
MSHWWITGMSGVGKTTIGELIAAKLNLPFIDTDNEIVQRACCAIHDIFAQRGENGFREIESLVITGLAQKESSVIALGAGALQREINLAQVQSSGKLIYLRAKLDLLMERAKTFNDRPLLAYSCARDLQTELEYMLAEREPNYLKAELIINIQADDSPDLMVKQILDAIR